MKAARLREGLATAFPDAVRSAVVEALRAAAEQASRHYDPSVGWNGRLFGTAIYTFHCHELKRLQDRAFDVPIRVRETSSALDFKLEVGEWIVACQRVAHAEVSFPSSPGTPGRVARENAFQLSLDLDLGHAYPRNVVVAYAANPVDGLRAVYLCIPAGATDGGWINEWGYIEFVWKAADASDLRPADFPPPAPVQEPALALRKRSSVKDPGEASA